MKKSFIILIYLSFCVNPQIFSQTFCRNPKADSTAGEIEKYVYKQYLSEKGKEKELHIALVHPVDKMPIKKRPLIIGLHGSGFLDTCFFEPCYVKYSENVLSRYFASQGFVTASIQYRLASPLSIKPTKIDDEKLKEIHYKAVQDARKAIKYIFENAEKFGVDTDNIFLIGASAGAITALHAAYLDDEEAPKNLIETYGKLEKKEKIKGVISLSGAIYDLSYLGGGDKIPLMIVHGKDDSIVPFEKGFYLGIKHLTPVFGGKAVFDEALKLGIPAKGYFYDFGHAYPSNVLKDIFMNANDFIVENLNCLNNEKSNGATGAVLKSAYSASRSNRQIVKRQSLIRN